LSDEEAVQRLQTLCIGACDGVQDLADDARYKALRKALIARADLRPLTPAFVAAQANLEALVRHLRETRDRSQRREMVRSDFKPLWDEIRGPGADPVSSASWTGRASPGQQAAVVRALAPAALAAIERLIQEEERLLDNGGPVEPDRQEALVHLKALHSALGELIELVEHGKPLDAALGRLHAIRQAAKVTLGKATAALPVTASALIAFGSVVGIAEIFVGNVVVSIAAGGLAGNTIKDVMLKKEVSAPTP
jgi:hypothetical protein